METVKCEIEQIERNVGWNNFYPACQTNSVKHEPCEIDNFNECGRHEWHDECFAGETGVVDHKNATDGYQEQNEEILDEKKVNPDLYHSECSDTLLTSKCISTQFKSEDDINSCYEDIKCETDSGLPHLKVKNEATSGDEDAKEQDTSSVPWGVYMPPMECDNKMQSEFCSEPLENDHSEELRMVDTKIFSCESELNIHETIHTREKPFHCKICSKAHSNSSDLIAHERIHNGEKPYHCIICSKSFSQKGNLRVHTRSHTGEKPFQCKFCTKTYTNTSDLKVHERVHTGEKPYHCKLCSKSFSQTSKLKVHQKVHTGEKPFECKTCSKAFFNSGGLRVHERTHTGEKPFHCKICLKFFNVMGQLKVHERVHSGEKPFQCQICFRGFSNSSNLRLHGKRIHNQSQ